MLRPTKAVQADDRQMPDRFAGGRGDFQQNNGRWVGEPVHAAQETRSNITSAQVDPTHPTMIKKYRKFTMDKPKRSQTGSKVFCNKGAVPPRHWRKAIRRTTARSWKTKSYLDQPLINSPGGNERCVLTAFGS